MKILSYRIKFQKRVSTIQGREAFLTRILFVFFGFIAVGLIFLLNGVNPITLFIFSNKSMLRIMLILLPNAFVTFIPLLCIAVGLAIPFKARIDNIGAEGQFVMGMLAAYWVAFEFPDIPSFRVSRAP